MMKKRLQIKSKHHYVWANYLLNWSDNNRDVYYTTKSLKIGFDSCKGIAQQKDFYKISYLNKQHIELIISILRMCPKHLQEQNYEYLKDFLLMQELQEIYTRCYSKDETADVIFQAFNNNAMENLHSTHENEVINIINDLNKHDLSVLDDKRNLFNFISFLAQQITRTKAAKERLIEIKNLSKDIQTAQILNVAEEAWWFISYMLGMNIANSICLDSKIYNISLLINNSESFFITSDQPVINIHNHLNPHQTDNDGLDLYYPLSPTVAFFIGKSKKFLSGNITVSHTVVNELNILMAKKAKSNLFGNTKCILNLFKKYIGNYTP